MPAVLISSSLKVTSAELNYSTMLQWSLPNSKMNQVTCEGSSCQLPMLHFVAKIENHQIALRHFRFQDFFKKNLGREHKGPRSSPRAAKRWEGAQRRGTRIAWAHDVGGILPPWISLGALVLTHPKNHRKSVHWSSQRYFRSTIFILWTYLYILLPWSANQHSPPAIYGSRTEPFSW